ncbi:hypothetical protein Droror1_Dr00021118 [Drosera rotundifolia]
MVSSLLEIKLISCKGLSTFNFFQKLQVYAVTSIGTDATNIRLSEHQRQEQRTEPDTVNDRDPVWNHSVSFDLSHLLESALSLPDLFLHFQIFHHGNIFGDKLIGSVRVHLKDLAAHHEVVRFVDYEVRGPDGKPNGVIHFSYKPIAGIHQPEALTITGYPMIDQDVPVMEVEGSRVYYPVIEEAQREISAATILDNQINDRSRSWGEADGDYYPGEYHPPMWHHPPPMWGPPPPGPPPPPPPHMPPPHMPPPHMPPFLYRPSPPPRPSYY